MHFEQLMNILNDPEELIDQLIMWGIIPPLEEISCIYCGSGTTLRIRKRENGFCFTLRCKSCSKEYSLFKNGFFTFSDEVKCRMKLPIDKIIKHIFYYFDGKSLLDLKSLCEIGSKSTLVDWTHYIREKTHEYISSDLLGGPDTIVQIDESLMRGRRKNNKGRYLLGDLIDLDPTRNSRRLNYGERENGPWVFGMIQSGTRKMKMFYVPDRKESTLLPILLAHVHPDTEIWSDEWKGYVN